MRLPLLALLAFASVAGCDTAEPGADLVLVPGDVRRYAFRSTITDSTGAVIADHADTLRARVVATGQRVEGLEDLTEVEYRSLVTGAVSQTWYRQSEDRLVEVAYENPLPVTAQLRANPEAARRSLLVLAGHVLGGDPAAGVIVRDDPRIVLDYPLEPGHAWVSFTDPFLSERRVERREPLSLPTGTRETAVIATTNDVSAGAVTWLDWVDDGGLVQRRITSEITLTGEEGEPLGSGVVHDEVTLIAVE